MDVESTMLPLGTKMPKFELHGIDEKHTQMKIFQKRWNSCHVYL
jgi:hypothetical protein